MVMAEGLLLMNLYMLQEETFKVSLDMSKFAANIQNKLLSHLSRFPNTYVLIYQNCQIR